MLPLVPGSPTHACPGWDIRVLANEGEEVGAEYKHKGQVPIGFIVPDARCGQPIDEVVMECIMFVR